MLSQYWACIFVERAASAVGVNAGLLIAESMAPLDALPPPGRNAPFPAELPDETELAPPDADSLHMLLAT